MFPTEANYRDPYPVSYTHLDVYKRQEDEDAEEALEAEDDDEVIVDPPRPLAGEGPGVRASGGNGGVGLRAEADFRARAAEAYAAYQSSYKKRFKWLPGSLFAKTLAKDLLQDAGALIAVLDYCGVWDPARDAKLAELRQLATERHGREKLLILSLIHISRPRALAMAGQRRRVRRR